MIIPFNPDNPDTDTPLPPLLITTEGTGTGVTGTSVDDDGAEEAAKKARAIREKIETDFRGRRQT